MKVKESKQVIETIVKTYIAEDGQEFQSESKCIEHDLQLKFENSFKKIEPLMVHEDNYVPCNGGENYESHLYRWFKVENQEQLDLINNFYNTDIKVNTFPEHICVEQYEEMNYDCYGTTLTACKEYVIKFFEEGFGIKISFE